MSFFVIRRVWRAVNKPATTHVATTQIPLSKVEQKPRGWKIAFWAMLGVVLLVTAIGTTVNALTKKHAQYNSSNSGFSYGSGSTVVAPYPEPNAVREIKGAPFVARLPDGGSIELLAVQVHPTTNQPWWLPDGSPSKYGADITLSDEYNVGSGVLALAKVNWPAATNGIGISLPNGQRFAMQDGHRLPMEDFSILAFQQAFATNQPATLHLQIGLGDWQTLTTQKPRLLGNWFGEEYQKQWSFSQTAAGVAKVTVDHLLDQPDKEFRFVAVDADGNEHMPNFCQTSHSARDIYSKYEMVFNGAGSSAPLLSKNLRAVRLQSRPYQMVEFRNVSLQPGFKTTVEVKDFGGEKQIASAAAPNLSFGPVVERVIPLDGSYIDFQTGSLLRKGRNNVTPTDAAVSDWMKQTGADAFAEGSPDGPRLVGIRGGSVFVGERAVTFESAQANAVDSKLEIVTQQNVSWEYAHGPGTFWFATHDGAKGILKITGFTDNPLGEKIRYKLVQNTGAK